MKLTEQVINILAAAQIDGSALRLTCGQLDRKTYEQVNKALEDLGGKWSRKARGHVFEGDPSEAVEMALQTGEAVSARKQFDFFQTPPALATRMVEMAGICDGDLVLEPSAGWGRILDAISDAAPKALVTLIELNPDNRAALSLKGYSAMHDDFMTFERQGEPYDAIVANPPFSKQQDVKHISRMLDMLSPGGRLVSVASASVMFRDNRITDEFRKLVDSFGGSINQLPEGTFKNEGTNVNTCLVTVGC